MFAILQSSGNCPVANDAVNKISSGSNNSFLISNNYLTQISNLTLPQLALVIKKTKNIQHKNEQ